MACGFRMDGHDKEGDKEGRRRFVVGSPHTHHLPFLSPISLSSFLSVVQVLLSCTITSCSFLPTHHLPSPACVPAPALCKKKSNASTTTAIPSLPPPYIPYTCMLHCLPLHMHAFLFLCLCV